VQHRAETAGALGDYETFHGPTIPHEEFRHGCKNPDCDDAGESRGDQVRSKTSFGQAWLHMNCVSFDIEYGWFP
jgi:hypothetical protein